jgi:cytochrome oxidase Cu insertion factor (SCO1/SenC/PrrC family)
VSRAFFRGATIALAFVIAALGFWRLKMAASKNAPPDYGSVAAFTLTDQDGKPFGSKDLVGKNWIADFFFTRCMGPCPLLTTRLAELQNKYKAKSDLAYVSFTVDPDYDQPAVLKKYAGTYNADTSSWKFLTGPRDTVYPLIQNNFKLAVAPGSDAPAGQIDIMHSTYFVLVDGRGHIRGFYNSLEPAALGRLRDDISHL